MKIAVYAIAKNEEKFVKRFCETAQLADVIVIADTGSTDRTVEIARECGAQVHEIFIDPWRFDKARDASLALVPKDVDVCLSLDLDELLLPGWREEIERLWDKDTTQMQYRFDGGNGLVFYHTKIHSRKWFHWTYPCHEYLKADVRMPAKMVHTDKTLIRHSPDDTKSRGQYLDILEMAVKEDPKCHRSAFYYARELTYRARWEDSIAEFKRYLELPTATWKAERCFAMRHIGKAYEELGQDGTDWLRRASVEEPGIREPWYELAWVYYRRRMWQECYAAAKMTVSITNKVPAHTMNPAAWTFLAEDLVALSAYRLGLKEEAIKYGELALEMQPNEERLKENLRFYKA